MVNYVTTTDNFSVPIGGVVYNDGVRSSNANRVVILSETRTRATDTDYKRLIATNGNATFQYRRTIIEKYSNPLWYAQNRIKISGRWRYNYGAIFPGFNLVPPTNWGNTQADVDDQALGYIKRKLATQVETARMLLPIGELYKTRDMIQNAAHYTERWLQTTDKMMQNIISKYMHVRRYRYKQHKWGGRKLRHSYTLWKGDSNWTENPLYQDMFGFASKRWLEYNFGVRPLLADIDNGFNALANWNYDREYSTKKFFGVAKKRQHSSSVPSSNNETFINYSYCKHYRIEEYTEYTAYIGGAFTIDLHSAEDYGLAQHLGVTLENVFPTVWELIPYSWIVDYFTTAGAYLEDVFTNDPCDTRYLYKTQFIKYNRKVQHQLTAINNAIIESSMLNHTSEMSLIKVVRTPLSSLPVRELRIKSADEIAVNSVGRLLNLVAVLASRGKSSRIGW